MNVNSKLFFLIFVFSFFLLNCQGDEEENNLIVEVDEEGEEWADSLFGKLSAKQQYYQHLIIEVPAIYQNRLDSLSSWIALNQPGALNFIDWNLDSVQRVKSTLDTLPIVQPFFYANYFEMLGAAVYPFWEANKLNRSFDYTNLFYEGGYHLLDFHSTISQNKSNINWLDSISKKQAVYPIVAGFEDNKAAAQFDDFISTIRTTKHNVRIDLDLFDTINFESYRIANKFQGLFIVRSKETTINNLLAGGTDFIFRRLESTETFNEWSPSAEEQKVVDESTRRILTRKSHNKKQKKENHFSEEIKFVALNLQQKSTALIRNEGKLIPFKGKFTIYAKNDLAIDSRVRKDNSVSTVKKEINLKNIQDIISSKGNKVLLLPDTCDESILSELNNVTKDKSLAIGFTNPAHFSSLNQASNLFFYPNFRNFDYEILTQQFTSRISMSGDFVAEDTIVKGMNIEKKLLARTDPNFCGIDADTLARISWNVNSVIGAKATPGCQVLVAKDGCIIYDRSFGTHTYGGSKPVTETSMYDLASLTKVVATTMVGMKLYEMNAYELNDSLQKYLPDSLRLHLRFPSTIRNLTFQGLFTHCTGMPAGFPIIKYMRYTTPEIGRYDKYFCDRPDSVYTTEVAENYFLEREYQDSMWLKLNQIFLNPDKSYHYSDVNMNTLYFIFKSIIQKSPDKYGFTQTKKQLKDKDLFVEFLYNSFYKPLGMNHTCYKPLKQYSRDIIVPTENESFWRKQLLWGHVHDPNAALHGGVAGNAGIFSTTNDLAVLCQMLLNKGIYNGKRYLNAETVDKFTARQENCFRGLGFNKPSFGSVSFGMSPDASLSTYGHTGFTGTCFWVDPEYGLIYIYLSNAVHPEVSNKDRENGIRKRLHQVIYDGMMLKEF